MTISFSPLTIWSKHHSTFDNKVSYIIFYLLFGMISASIGIITYSNIEITDAEEIIPFDTISILIGFSISMLSVLYVNYATAKNANQKTDIYDRIRNIVFSAYYSLGALILNVFSKITCGIAENLSPYFNSYLETATNIISSSLYTFSVFFLLIALYAQLFCVHKFCEITE